MAEVRRMGMAEWFMHFRARFGVRRADASKFRADIETDGLLGEIILGSAS